MAAAFVGTFCGLAAARLRAGYLVAVPPPKAAAGVATVRAAGPGHETAASRVGSGLLAAGVLGALAAPLWRRPGGSRGVRGVGRIVVHGRNYETNIKKKKGPAEAKKAKITAKHLSKIVMALKKGPAEESLNNELSRSIKAALKDNVPRATIDTRIKKALESSEDVEELEMQGYGNGGFPVIVQCLTENTNRTRTAVREAFKDCNAKVGLDGCVDHMFNKCAVIKFEGADEETIFEASMEAEVEDCVAVEDGVEVIALPQNLHSTLDVLEKQGFEASSSGVEFRPLEEKKLSKEGTYDALRLQHFLNEIDDVTDVHIAGELEDDVELNFNHYGKPLAYGKKGM